MHKTQKQICLLLGGLVYLQANPILLPSSWLETILNDRLKIECYLCKKLIPCHSERQFSKGTHVSFHVTIIHNQACIRLSESILGLNKDCLQLRTKLHVCSRSNISTRQCCSLLYDLTIL